MKIKLIIATMSMLGFVSSPLFAANATQPTTTPVKHKHHHANMMAKHHQTRHQEMMEEREYNEEPMTSSIESPPMMPTPTPVVVLIDMTQNLGRTIPGPDWYNRIGIGGGMNFDMLKWGNNGHFQGENYKRFSVNDAYLNVTGNINEGTKAFASLSYGNPTETHFVDSDKFSYSSVYKPDTLTLEQAFITIADFNCTPLFLQIGKQFTDFSRYEIHPITRSLTQVLSEALNTQVKLGFVIPSGFHGSVYVLQDPLHKAHEIPVDNNNNNNNNDDDSHHTSKNLTDYGAALGYEHSNGSVGWDVGGAYINSLTAAQDVAHAVTNFTEVKGLHDRVGAFALYGDINTGPFTFDARFTTATSSFDRRDLSRHRPHDEDDNNNNDIDSGHDEGARPWALGLQAGYHFEYFCKEQNVFIGYQSSSQASAIGLPKYRWLAGYEMDVMRNTVLGLEWDHDKGYCNNDCNDHSGTYNLVSLRAAVKFG